MSLLCCDNGLFLELEHNIFEQKNVFVGGTDFFFKVRETAFIDNVYLVTDGHYIKADHYIRGYFKDEYEKTNCKICYSIFHARYVYEKPSKQMESHFCYRIDYSKEHVSTSNFFDVSNCSSLKEV